MRVLVTGSSGYIGSALVPLLRERGHEVEGFDLGLFASCGFRHTLPSPDRRDIRSVSHSELRGFDAVVHLAALSNDPLGNLDPRLTYSINQLGSLDLARAAKAAGVVRFVFASSCSLYGAGQSGLVTETAPFAPLTPYGESKKAVEFGLHELADENFTPTYLRNATVYGVSPALRLDVVVNNLTAWAIASGEVVLQSDGMAWRPQLHVEDACRAIWAVLEAPRDVVHDEAFNVGATAENYQVRSLAEIVSSTVAGAKVVRSPGSSRDSRSYRVDFAKLEHLLPAAGPRWSVPAGVEELAGAFQSAGLTVDDFPRYTRLAEIKRLLEAGSLDDELRWV